MILVDNTHAVMGPGDLAALSEYSCSLPTGTTIGKRWKRDLHGYLHLRPPQLHAQILAGPQWMMGEYEEFTEDPGRWVGIRWREIMVVSDGL